MKVILSRKGFDSGSGGYPSPILPDGTLLSIPIPGDDPQPDNEGMGYKYDSIMSGYENKSYMEILSQIAPDQKRYGEYCHLDPDLRRNRVVPKNWKPAFGQVSKAQKHLQNQGIGSGDLFLFFGLFRQTEKRADGKLEFTETENRKHIIFGYLQIGQVLQGDNVAQLNWHPHSRWRGGNNTIYVASDSLVIDGIDTNLPGSGTFRYDENLVLTKDDQSCTKWKLLDIFKSDDITLTYHPDKQNRIKDGYFQSVYRGQEFVFSENCKVTQWAYGLIKESCC